MSSPLAPERTTTALDVLAEPRRRYLLATLVDREDASPIDLPSTVDPTSLESLATEVATGEHDCPIVTDEQCERIHISLVHAHVPRLADVGVLHESDGEDATVALADHPILEAEWVRTLIADPTGEAFPADEATLNWTLEALRAPRARTVCAALAERRGAISVSDLAAAIVAREGDAETRLVDVTEAECAAVAATLVHEHLPALSEAGLVEYDDAARRVAIATDAPQWRADWLVEGPLADIADLVETFRESPVASSGDGVGAGGPTADGPSTDRGDDGIADRIAACRTIEGRENVFDRGHEIANDADEELFVTVPDGNRIGRECLECWRDAVDRGVDVYVGSRSPRVRDTIRSSIPGATVCEPQFDWLNFPIEEANHGHVVFADRDRALIVTTEKSAPDGELRVGAIAGDGRENALVSLICEHLEPRLERLTTARDERDAQDETPLPM